MNEWKETILGKVTIVESGGTPSTINESFWSDDIPWITPKDLSNYKGVFIERGERSISKFGLASSSAKLLPKHTILFSSRAPIGYVVISANEVTTNQGFKNIICDETKSHYKYFYYLLKNKANHIEKLSSGSTFSEASASLMRSIEIKLPTLQEQKAIANVLTAFDDKIELLQQQNTTLETIAQTIFKEWFGKYQVGDELPEGWRIGKLSEIADFLNGLALQKYPPKKGLETLPVIKIRELKQGITSNTDKANTELDSKYIINNGDVLFSWSGSLEVVIWQYGKGALNQHLFKVTSENYPKWFYYYWILHHLNEFKGIASSKATTMGHINRNHLDLAEVLIPDEQTFFKLNKLFEPILEKLEINNSQIQSLTKTRDALLPKLMSGQVRVKSTIEAK